MLIIGYLDYVKSRGSFELDQQIEDDEVKSFLFLQISTRSSYQVNVTNDCKEIADFWTICLGYFPSLD